LGKKKEQYSEELFFKTYEPIITKLSKSMKATIFSSIYSTAQTDHKKLPEQENKSSHNPHPQLYLRQ